MDFELTDDQERIRRVAREFADAELGNAIAPYDERHEFPHSVVRKLGPLGFLGALVPEEYGGAGLDYVGYARSEEHTSELQSLAYLVCRLLLEKKNNESFAFSPPAASRSI